MITYKKGDATDPIEAETEKVVLVHCVNDINVMGSGIAYAISKKWPEVKRKYHAWGNKTFYIDKDGFPVPFQLGYIQNIPVSDNIIVCNLLGQRDVRIFCNMPPVRYQSIMEGLYRLRAFMLDNNIKTVVSGRMAAGLAGGSWEVIEKILNRVFQDDIKVVIYDLPNEDWPGTVYEK